MFRNMAASFIKTVRIVEGEVGQPKVAGRIITTVEKAKELRPYVEKLVTMARKALVTDAKAAGLGTTAPRNSPEWKAWRESKRWQEWAQAKAPGVAYRRRAFALLRDTLAVEILFSDLAQTFATRNGGYTRILRIVDRRLGDGGYQALIEFVGNNDRVKRAKKKRQAPVAATAPAVVESTPAPEAPAAEAAAGESAAS
ncbi:MAG: bL17 family ribosomal protein [Planctomycetota bacterium]|nr:bL17 family ribosomal protein [Planctomycetota bacterium]